MRKPIIRQHLRGITSIIDELFTAIEEKYAIWKDVKLILLFKSLL